MGIDRRPAGHGLVGIDRAVGDDAGDALEHGGDHRHARRAAHQQDPRDVAPLESGGGQELAAGVGGPFQQVGGHLLELLARDRDLHGAVRVLDADRGVRPGAERVFGLDGGLVESVERRRDRRGGRGRGPLEGLGREVHQSRVPVVAAQLDVAVGGQGADVAGSQTQQGGVERAAAEVVDHDVHLGPTGFPGGSDSRGPRRSASAAAVGSLTMSSRARPAISPASAVALRRGSSK